MRRTPDGYERTDEVLPPGRPYVDPEVTALLGFVPESDGHYRIVGPKEKIEAFVRLARGN